MRFKNTSSYPGEEAARLIALATKGINLTGVAVHLKNAKSCAYRGRAYMSVPRQSGAPASARRLITLGIGEPNRFPCNNMMTSVRWGGPWLTRSELGEASGSEYRIRGRGDGLFQRGEVVRHPYGGKRSPFIEMADWRECLVAVAAHEARHIWQFAHGKPVSEVDCERFAAKALERYRSFLADSTESGGTRQ